MILFLLTGSHQQILYLLVLSIFFLRPHTYSSQRQAGSINRMRSRQVAAGSGFYWEYDRFKSNLLLSWAPPLLNGSPRQPKCSSEASEDKACPACSAISSSPTLGYTHNLCSPASVTVWWAPWKRPGKNIQAAPAGLRENQTLFSSAEDSKRLQS